jgi:succinoglycan biosynthesis transport protein ExoP
LTTSTHSPTGSAAGPDTNESALRYYLRILRRRKRVVVFAVALPVLLALLYSLTQQPVYQGTAEVLLNRQNLANALTNTPDPTAQVNDFIRIVQTQANVARSPAVASRTVQAAGERLTADQFLEHSSVVPARDADFLTFHVWSGDPAAARRLTNHYAEEYTKYRVALDTASLRRAQQEVSQRIQQLSASGDSNSRLSRSLEDKLQELDTLQALQTSNATVISMARESEQIAPRKFRNVALGLIAGLLLAVALLIVLETVDTRVRSEQEVEERLGLNPLARIGAPHAGLAGQLQMLAAPNAPEGEAFRLLRTNLQFASLGRRPRSLLITSSVQAEGKSTTIANLAVTMARAGQRVALVDLDLRRPSIQRLFGLGPKSGLTDVALGYATLDDSLDPVDVGSASGSGSLVVLGAGTPPPNPGEFIESDAVASVIRELSADHCDILLIDAPPMLLLGDALMLSRLADAVFVCARVPFVTRAMLDELRRSLARAQVRTLGFVLTGDALESTHRYGYGYGYTPSSTQASATADQRTDDEAVEGPLGVGSGA